MIVKKKRQRIDTEDIIGRVFGRLTVLEYTGRDGKEKYVPVYTCKCECGNIKYTTNRRQLLRGLTTSCGCKRKEILLRQVTERQRVSVRKHTEEREKQIAAATKAKQPTPEDIWKRKLLEREERKPR